MKKIFLLFVILTSWVTSQSFASDSLEHFRTKDERHMCSVFMKNEFKLCSEFGIEYKGDTVVSGKEPFFYAGTPIQKIKIGDHEFCVEGRPNIGSYEIDSAICDLLYTERTDIDEQQRIRNSNIDTVQITKMKESNQIIPQMNDIVNNVPSTKSSTCTLNGKPVDCVQMAETAGFWLKMGLWGFLIFGVLFLIGGIFWLMMLIHALSNPIPNKIMWVAVIFFISLIGAIIYYFVIKRKCTVVYAQPGVVQTVQNSPTMQTSTSGYTTPVPPIVPPTVVSPSIPVATAMSVPVVPTVDGVPPSSTSL